MPVCILMNIQRPRAPSGEGRAPQLLCLSYQMPWKIRKKQRPHCCLPSGTLVWGDKTPEAAGEKRKLEKTENRVMGQRQLHAVGFFKSDDPGWRGHERRRERTEGACVLTCMHACAHGSVCTHMHVQMCTHTCRGRPAWPPPRPAASLGPTVPATAHLGPSCPSPGAGPGPGMLCASPPLSCKLKNEPPSGLKNFPKGAWEVAALTPPYCGELGAVSVGFWAVLWPQLVKCLLLLSLPSPAP